MSRGTTVEVHKVNGYSIEEQSKLKEYLQAKLGYNARAKIFLNGNLINPLARLTYQNGDLLNYESGQLINLSVNEEGYSVTDPGVGMNPEVIITRLLIPRVGTKEIPKEGHDQEEIRKNTRIFYKVNQKLPSEKIRSEISILISGVYIEGIEIEGYNLPEKFVLELPSWTPLPESRDRIFLDKGTQEAIEVAMDKVLGTPPGSSGTVDQRRWAAHEIFNATDGTS
jgi:hypothetical protein